ncbi:sensor domain-containing diguanylate cyclase [Variovorax sp. RHLX14]|uniref:sensor domain-containing diguanylate cyclase n=1 Tax=Variovorax sp. RHLX14 TaxID=1259731 RepID=UPI003F48FDD7
MSTAPVPAGLGGPTGPEEEYEALLQFLYMAPIGLAQMRIDGEIAMINPLCGALLMPLSQDGGLSNLFDVLADIAPDLPHRVRAFEPLHGKICDAMHLQIDSGLPGRRDPQVLSLTLLKLDAERLMAVMDDVSVSVKRERELRMSQAWIHTIVTGITDYALLSLDRDGAIQQWNPGIRQVTGFEAEDTVGKPYSIIFPDDDRLRHRTADRLREADLSGWNLEEGWLRRANGEKYWGSCLIAPLHPPENVAGDARRAAVADHDDDRAYSLIVRDISDHREANEALRRSVFSDHLTGLVNRRAFYEAAAVAMERCMQGNMPLSVIVFDADHFKIVNDTYGHAAGDAVLRHLAAGLSANFRSTDIVSRFGGEEFIVLMPGASEDDALTMAQRMCQHVSANAPTVDGVAISYTVSAGVAGLVPEIGSIDELLKRADAAMYMAKTDGRNRVVRWLAETTT